MLKRALLLFAAAITGIQPATTVVDLQPFRESSSAHVRTGSGREGAATLVNLNPNINVWFLLTVDWKDGSQATAWHLENAMPRKAQIMLDSKGPGGLLIAEGGERYSCDLFGSRPNALEQGRASGSVYYPLCGGRLYLRNPAKGARTTLEAATEFLRNQVWGGEKVIDVFHRLMADRNRETGDLRDRSHAPGTDSGETGKPLSALIDPAFGSRVIAPANLGIRLESQAAEKAGMVPGAWYAAAENGGIFVSVFQPNLTAPSILQSYSSRVNTLDSTEAASLVYLIAFDLDRYDLGYALGTKHPAVNWSDRVPAGLREPGLPGPDGIGSIAPLVSTGMVGPAEAGRTVAAFTAGFKRNHAAFRQGELATKNHGSHYGVVENGVVFSKLQPGLATLFVMDDGFIDMKTWSEAEDARMPKMKFARQNGVALVEFDEAAHATVPGRLVNNWGAGNWSGSENEKLRTLRAGAALQKSQGKRFLIYAVFSDATPSAMARVLQAYQCSYGMLLDMNALEHTYLAVYRRPGADLAVDHLISGMSVLDKSLAGKVVPRFLGYPDNRDFFYMMARSRKETKP